MKKVFAFVVFRRGWVGGGGREADFSTSLRFGRNDGGFCWESMVEGDAELFGDRSKDKSNDKSKCGGSSLRSE
jgi:hypothetical protein